MYACTYDNICSTILAVISQRLGQIFYFIYIYIQHESIKKLDVTREKADSQIIVKCSPNHDFYDSVPQSWLGHVLC